MTDQTASFTLPGYTELQWFARGGFSSVYRSTQVQYNRPVAVKVLDVGLDDERSRRQYQRECDATGRLTGHPNIVTVLDSGFTPTGKPFLVMDLCVNGTMGDRLAVEGPLPVADVLRTGVKIAGALETAHQGGILHRDLKPANILISAYGEPALSDFGIAAVTSHLEASVTMSAMTPNHAPPEVLEGSRPTPASDVYSLSSTLYTLLAGRPPFAQESGHSILAFITRVLTADVPPIPRADIPPELMQALVTGLSKDPAERQASAALFGYELQQAQVAMGMPYSEMVTRTFAVGSIPERAAGITETIAARRCGARRGRQRRSGAGADPATVNGAPARGSRRRDRSRRRPRPHAVATGAVGDATVLRPGSEAAAPRPPPSPAARAPVVPPSSGPVGRPALPDFGRVVRAGRDDHGRRSPRPGHRAGRGRGPRGEAVEGPAIAAIVVLVLVLAGGGFFLFGRGPAPTRPAPPTPPPPPRPPPHDGDVHRHHHRRHLRPAPTSERRGRHPLDQRGPTSTGEATGEAPAGVAAQLREADGEIVDRRVVEQPRRRQAAGALPAARRRRQSGRAPTAAGEQGLHPRRRHLVGHHHRTDPARWTRTDLLRRRRLHQPVGQGRVGPGRVHRRHHRRRRPLITRRVTVLAWAEPTRPQRCRW